VKRVIPPKDKATTGRHSSVSSSIEKDAKDGLASGSLLPLSARHGTDSTLMGSQSRTQAQWSLAFPGGSYEKLKSDFVQEMSK
jgi:hypothetical protein